MARIRTLKPEFFRSRSLSRCSRDARITFAGMWCEADSAGRGVADSRILKGSIWPLEDDITHAVIDAHLIELEREHITLYEVGGERYYAVRNWEKHQAASYRQGEPVHPAPPADAPCTSRNANDTPSSAYKEGKGEEGNAQPEAAHAPDDFEEFWNVYPRKTDRKRAARAWRTLKVADRAAALASLPAHVRKWHRDNPGSLQYVPHPTTWLHNRRWEDQLNGRAQRPDSDMQEDPAMARRM